MSSRFEVERVDGDDAIPLNMQAKGDSQNSITKPDETEQLMQKNDSVSIGSSVQEEQEFLSTDSKENSESVASDVDLQTADAAKESNHVADESDNGKTRFHVEFVEPKKDNIPPTSPGNDSHVDSHDTHSKTYYLRTFGHNTQEAVPMVAYYQNTASVQGKVARPTLDQLHEAHHNIESSAPPRDDNDGVVADSESPPAPVATPIKFGWIKGVLIRCVLNIWGVMLFLRLSWIVGQSGIGQTVLIILLSTVVTCITTLSMSAICTNGQVRGGGAYYLISRSLGPEFGGAIGLIFSLANAVAVALYVVGFAETVVELMSQHGANITGNDLNDVRIIGTVTVILLLGITQLGMAWESKMQMGLLVILLIAILNFLIGTFIPSSRSKEAFGYFSYSGTIAAENFGPNYRNGNDFFTMFSIFFPAATGILAGCNISGDLKDAQKAIPKGTLLAIAITSSVYAIVAVILGCVEVRVASGMESDFVGVANASNFNCTTAACQYGWYYTSAGGDCVESADVEIAQKCFQRGLLNDYQAMQNISLVGALILAGIFAATLSSALTSLVSAPKVFQAVCRDKIFPAISFFGKGYTKNDEPRLAYILAFAIALGCILIGKLNAIAPIISNFFLASYTLINYSCFSASLAKSPGWRPAFKYYNMWLSLLGAIVCCAIMFVIQWWAALITIVIVIALYKYVDYKKPDVNWGSSTQAYSYTQALNHTLKLTSVDDHIKNFRPQLMVLSGHPEHRPALVHLGSQITKNISLMVCANIRPKQEKQHYRSHLKENQVHQKWLMQQRIKAFYSSVVSSSLSEGALTMMQLSGLGKLRTNTLLMGFKSDWRTVSGPDLVEYISIVHNAFNNNYCVCILRMKEGLDISQYLSDNIDESANDMPKSKSNSSLSKKDGFLTDSGEIASSGEANIGQQLKKTHSSKLIKTTGEDYKGSTDAVDKPAIKATTLFQSVQEKGKTIDVWWLFDDGGLTILIPYLISTRKQWSGCRMRIFTGGKKERIDQDKRTMAQLLSKFRISFEDVIVIGDINMKPSKNSIAEFEKMIEPYRLFDESDTPPETESSKPAEPWKISDNELFANKEKTNRQIRVQELLQEYSKNAALIMMTLPIARKGICSPALYMAWLEELSKDLPPIVLLRGNQTSVLTFYS